MTRTPATRRHLVQTAAVVGGLMLVFGLTLGAQGHAIAMAPSILWLAWRFDNHTGSLLMITVLMMLTVGVLALHLLLMAVTH